jgi:hypothetical protein
MSRFLHLGLLVAILLVAHGHAVQAPSLPPPLGARCNGYAKPPPEGKSGTIFSNSEPLPLTWNITEGCPLMPYTEWVCCQKSQYDTLQEKLVFLGASFQGCPACDIAIRNMWCHYTCSPFQYQYDRTIRGDNTTGQVFQTELVVTPNFAQRMWQSCRNGIFGQFQIKVMFPNVEGFFAFMADFSTNQIVGRVVVDDGVNPVPPNVSGLNCTTVQEDFSCSSGKVHAKPAYYPLPEARIGPLSAQTATAILIGFILICLSFVGFLNGSHDREQLKDLEDEASNGETSSLMTRDPSALNGTDSAVETATERSLLSEKGSRNNRQHP